MEGDTFALDCIFFDLIQIWLKYVKNEYNLLKNRAKRNG